MIGRSRIDVVFIVKWAIIICLLVVVGGSVINLVAPRVTDVTHLVKLDKEDIEEALDIYLLENPDMIKKIYEYTDSEIAVNGDSNKGIGVVYLDGKQNGLHIDNKKYSMFNINMGDAMVDIEDRMTFEYDENFIVVNDLYEGQSTAVFYCNKTKNECLIVIYNDLSNRVVAMTYFSDMRKVTEQLSSF